MPLIRSPSTPPLPAAPAQAETLSALMAGTDAERWSAARAAGSSAENAPALGHALMLERDARVREAIFTSLARINTSESVEVVLPHLRSDDAQVRTGALDALRAMPEQVAVHMPVLLRDPDPDVRLLACDLGRVLPTEKANRLLAQVLDTEGEINVCAAALDVLADMGSPDVLPALARCAERFANDPFLNFSIKITADRISAQRSQGE